MYKIGNDLIKKVMVGTTEVKQIYVGKKRVYPNITDQLSGTNSTEWIYNLPKRSRIVTPWTQVVYGDGSLGEKVPGTDYQEEETAIVSYQYGSWNYTTIESSGTRSRIKTSIYTFNDGTEKTTDATETDKTSGHTESYIYSFSEQNRTKIIVYKFSDTTSHTIHKTPESGDIKVIFPATFDSTHIEAGGGSVTVKTPTDPYMTWNKNRIDKKITLTNLTLVGLATGFSIGTLTVTAANRGRELGNNRTCSVYLRATTIIDGENVTVKSESTTITQVANLLSLTSGSIAAFPASFRVISSSNYHTAKLIYNTPFVFEYSSKAIDRVSNLSDLQQEVTTENWIDIAAAGQDYISFRCQSWSGSRSGSIEVRFKYKTCEINTRINVEQTSRL